MKLIVISSPSPKAGELDSLNRMLDHGLQTFHLRRPEWSRQQSEAFIQSCSPLLRAKTVLHSDHELVSSLGLKGRHFTSWARPKLPITAEPEHSSSMSLHSLQGLQLDLSGLDYVFLSPIFDSISKQGYRAAFEAEALAVALQTAKCPVIALGGISPQNIPIAASLGFSGVAALGSIWQGPDPVAEFRNLLQSCGVAGPQSPQNMGLD